MSSKTVLKIQFWLSVASVIAITAMIVGKNTDRSWLVSAGFYPGLASLTGLVAVGLFQEKGGK